MADKKIIKADYVSAIKDAQIAVECTLDAGEDSIVDVLAREADAYCVTAEVMVGEATVTGRVNYKVAYVNADGKVKALDYYSDFKTSVDVDVSPDTRLFVFGKVIEVEEVRRGDNTIVLKAIVTLSIVGVCKREYESESEAECTKSVVIKESTLKEIAEGSFIIDGEYETGGMVEDVVLLDTSLVLKEGKAGRDSILVSGVAVANVTYTDDKGLTTKCISLPFCEELASLSATPGDDIYLYGYVKDARIVLTGDNDNTTLRVEVTIALRCPIFSLSDSEILCDCYGIKKKLQVSREEGETYVKNGEWSFDERVSGITVLPDDAEGVARVITVVLAKNDVLSVESMDGAIVTDGVVHATVIYEDMSGLIRSCQVEVPYNVSAQAEGSDRCGETYLRSAISEVTAIGKRAREIEVMCVIKFYAYQCKRARFEYVNKIEEEEGEIQRDALTVYMRREGEDDWDIAKALAVPVEAVEAKEKYVVCYHPLV